MAEGAVQSPLPSAEHVARHFLFLASREREPMLLTQMHLHKLLYLAQGWSLGSRGVPLFQGSFSAWKHGPVEMTVRPIFKRYGRDAVPNSESAEGNLDSHAASLLLWVWRRYRGYSASGLRRLTHKQSPWRDARARRDAGSKRITDEAIARWFSAEHDGVLRKHGLDPDEVRRSRQEAARGESVSWDEFKATLGNS